LRHRGQWYELDINDKSFNLSVDQDGPEPVTVNVQGKRLKLNPGTTHAFALALRKAGRLAVVKGRAKARPA
jgi:hypothetical protein